MFKLFTLLVLATVAGANNVTDVETAAVDAANVTTAAALEIPALHNLTAAPAANKTAAAAADDDDDEVSAGKKSSNGGDEQASEKADGEPTDTKTETKDEDDKAAPPTEPTVADKTAEELQVAKETVEEPAVADKNRDDILLAAFNVTEAAPIDVTQKPTEKPDPAATKTETTPAITGETIEANNESKPATVGASSTIATVGASSTIATVASTEKDSPQINGIPPKFPHTNKTTKVEADAAKEEDNASPASFVLSVAAAVVLGAVAF